MNPTEVRHELQYIDSLSGNWLPAMGDRSMTMTQKQKVIDLAPKLYRCVRISERVVYPKGKK